MSTTAATAKPKAFSRFEEIELLVRGFEDGTWPRSEWNHGEHLAMAAWYMVCYPEAEALERIREGILRYNRAVGIVTTRESGYHETMTVFWAWMVKDFLRNATLDCALADLFNEMIGRLSDRSLPFKYYTRERLLSWEARKAWMEPDLQPLPAGRRKE